MDAANPNLKRAAVLLLSTDASAHILRLLYLDRTGLARASLIKVQQAPRHSLHQKQTELALRQRSGVLVHRY